MNLATGRKSCDGKEIPQNSALRTKLVNLDLFHVPIILEISSEDCVNPTNLLIHSSHLEFFVLIAQFSSLKEYLRESEKKKTLASQNHEVEVVWDLYRVTGSI